MIVVSYWMYYTSGTYVDTLQTVDGCDSIITMDMTNNNAISTNDNMVSCDSAMGTVLCITLVEHI